MWSSWSKYVTKIKTSYPPDIRKLHIIIIFSLFIKLVNKNVMNQWSRRQVLQCHTTFKLTSQSAVNTLNRPLIAGGGWWKCIRYLHKSCQVSLQFDLDESQNMSHLLCITCADTDEAFYSRPFCIRPINSKTWWNKD